MATVSKTKDSGEGWWWWWWMEGEITLAFCISCFLLGGPACQEKEGETDGKEKERKAFNAAH